MAELNPKLQWQTTFTPKELNVVLKSLGGRDMTDEEEIVADELCNRMTRMKVAATRNVMKQMDQLENNLGPISE